MPGRRYSKRGSYYTKNRFPSKKTERRLVMPQIQRRPVRFQTRALIRYELFQGDSWWLVMHRRGISRPKIGLDPLEARAVPHSLIRGTLPERIIYKSLVKEFHMIPDVDFYFQSSLQGGRIDTGGIVADFMLPAHHIVINPAGPTHNERLRIWKDEEQTMALAEMGYTQYIIPEEKVYDEYYLTNWLRRLLGWMHTGGNGSQADFDNTQLSTTIINDQVMTLAMEISDYIHTGQY